MVVLPGLSPLLLLARQIQDYPFTIDSGFRGWVCRLSVALLLITAHIVTVSLLFCRRIHKQEQVHSLADVALPD